MASRIYLGSHSNTTNKDQGIIFATALSRLLGWLYFSAWTASFWPQALLMYRRKSVVGISMDFISLNAFGFVCYSIFNLAFLISDKVQQQYRNTHHGQENLVRWNDAFFAIHAVLIASWQLFVTRIYKRAPGQKVSLWCKITLGILISIFLLTLTTCVIGGGDDDSILRWIDFINICSYIKLFITLIKYSVSSKYMRHYSSCRQLNLSFHTSASNLSQLFSKINSWIRY